MACPPNCPFCRAQVAKETPVACQNPDTCKWCNPEPLSLEGDIRYLKGVVQSRDNRIAELEQKVLTLEGKVNDADRWLKRYQQEILQLEQECETYRLALDRVRAILDETAE